MAVGVCSWGRASSRIFFPLKGIVLPFGSTWTG